MKETRLVCARVNSTVSRLVRVNLGRLLFWSNSMYLERNTCARARAGDDQSARDSFIYRLNYQTRRIKETALLYRCARIVSGPRSMPCLRRHTEGPPGARGARGPGSVRAGAFAAEHLARWALLASSPLCPPSPPSRSPLPAPLSLSLSRAITVALSLPCNLSRGGFYIPLSPLPSPFPVPYFYCIL